MMKKKLKYYGGEGYGYCKPYGKFEVRANKTVKFTLLSAARHHYDNLEEEKSIWDVTRGAELLECHTY